MPNKVSLANIEETDPQIVAFFAIASDAHDLLEDLTLQICSNEIDSADRAFESLRRLIVYQATLFNESFLASSHLCVLGMARAQIVLNRQLFELMIRSRWYAAHKDEALKVIDSLPKTAWKESKPAKDVVEASIIASVQANYEAWKAENPGLDDAHIPDEFTKMAKEVLGDRYTFDFLWHYSLPSVLVHGKAQGMADVMIIEDDKRLRRSQESVLYEPASELGRALGIAMEYAVFLVQFFGFDLAKISMLHTRFADTMRSFGMEPEMIQVKMPRTRD